MKPTSRAAGRAAQGFKHDHHYRIVRALELLKSVRPKDHRKTGFTPYRIARASHVLDVAQVFRRLSELVNLGVIEVTEHLGTTPSGRKCSCYRLKPKKK